MSKTTDNIIFLSVWKHLAFLPGCQDFFPSKSNNFARRYLSVIDYSGLNFWGTGWRPLIWKQNPECSSIWSVLSTNMMPEVQNSTPRNFVLFTQLLKMPYILYMKGNFYRLGSAHKQHKWILCLDLGPILKIPHYRYANKPKPPKFKTLLIPSIFPWF